MVENKYPKYVTTDSDLWNSADDAYFYVSKGEAKPLTENITSIIEYALESGLLREATKLEIEEYELKNEIEKKIQERKIERGKTFNESKNNYLSWKANDDKIKNLKNTIINKNSNEVKGKTTTIHVDPVISDIEPIVNKTTTTLKTEIKKPLTSVETALKQKATVRTDNM